MHIIDRPNETIAAQIAWVVSKFKQAPISVRREVFEQLQSDDADVTVKAANTLFDFIEKASPEELAFFTKEQFGTDRIDLMCYIYNPLRKLAEHFYYNMKGPEGDYQIETYDASFYKDQRKPKS